jgi:hypothetical protein
MGPQVKQILVVASKTANSDRLMKEIEARAAAEGCRFTLLIPDASDREKGDRTLEMVLPLMRRAARAPVKGLVDGPDTRSSRCSAPSRRGALTRSSSRRCQGACPSGCDGTSSLASRGWVCR